MKRLMNKNILCNSTGNDKTLGGKKKKPIHLKEKVEYIFM